MKQLFDCISGSLGDRLVANTAYSSNVERSKEKAKDKNLLTGIIINIIKHYSVVFHAIMHLHKEKQLMCPQVQLVSVIHVVTKVKQISRNESVTKKRKP